MPPKHDPTYRYGKRGFRHPDEEEESQEFQSLEDLATELLRMINQRLSPDDIETYIDTNVDPRRHGRLAQVDLLFLTLLHAGRQSYSHVLSFIQTYKNVLLKLVSG